ncbi:hypothetical protein Hanom_Chr09g00815421 [Helianthus anomalus]
MAINDELLEQVYHENCPGCKVERDKRIRTGYPIKELISIWVVVLCVGEHIYSLFISSSSLFHHLIIYYRLLILYHNTVFVF